jgi:hypothetical protein
MQMGGLGVCRGGLRDGLMGGFIDVWVYEYISNV